MSNAGIRQAIGEKYGDIVTRTREECEVDVREKFAHPVATAAPTKLEDYKTHQDPPGISGELMEGRICYDTSVLENKGKAIYYQAQPAA